MPKTKDSDVKFKSWGDLILALETDYTVSFKQVCRILKTSRSWVTKYIRPFVRTAYISSGIRADGSKGVNWLPNTWIGKSLNLSGSTKKTLKASSEIQLSL